MNYVTLKYKYRESKTLDKETLDALLNEDLALLHYAKILNGETLNDLAFFSGVSPQYLIDLMKEHNERVRKQQELYSQLHNPKKEEGETKKDEQSV